MRQWARAASRRRRAPAIVEALGAAIVGAAVVGAAVVEAAIVGAAVVEAAAAAAAAPAPVLTITPDQVSTIRAEAAKYQLVG